MVFSRLSCIVNMVDGWLKEDSGDLPPTFSMKWSANALPRCGVPIVVTDLTVNV